MISRALTHHPLAQTMPNFDMNIESDVSLGSVPMPLQRGASALIRYELRKWLSHKAVAPHAMKIKRTPPGEQQAAEAKAAAEAAAVDAAAEAAEKAAAAGTPSSSGFSSAQYGYGSSSEQPPPEPPEPPAFDAVAPTGGLPSGPEASEIAAFRPRPEPPKPAVSDEDLQRAILAALMKHDNPRVGVGRASLGRGLSGITSWKK